MAASEATDNFIKDYRCQSSKVITLPRGQIKRTNEKTWSFILNMYFLAGKLYSIQRRILQSCNTSMKQIFVKKLWWLEVVTYIRQNKKGAVSRKCFLPLHSILQWNLSRIQELKQLEKDEQMFFSSPANLSAIERRKRRQGELSARSSDDDFNKI